MGLGKVLLSPSFYAAVSDWAMLDLITTLELHHTSFVFHELPLVGINFMDDSVLWESTRLLIQR